MSNPIYKLRDLINDKYGEDRFVLGCEITARWVTIETDQPCSTEDVQQWSDLTVEDSKEHYNSLMSEATVPLTHKFLTVDHAEALRQLFGLQSSRDLFNNIPWLEIKI